MNTPSTARRWRLAGAAAALASVLALASACGTSSASGIRRPGARPPRRPVRATGPGRASAAGTVRARNNDPPRTARSRRYRPGRCRCSRPAARPRSTSPIRRRSPPARAADLSAVVVGGCITAAAIPAGGGQGSGGTAASAAPTPAPGAVLVGRHDHRTVHRNHRAAARSRQRPVHRRVRWFRRRGTGERRRGTERHALRGSRPGRAGGTRRSNRRTARDSGRGFGQRAGGTVASVAGDAIVVTQTDPQTQQSTQRTVTVTGSTTFTKTGSATTDALKVGQCAVVQGSADNKGAVTATSIEVSSPPAGSTTCTTGFGGGRSRNGQSGSAAPSTTGS